MYATIIGFAVLGILEIIQLLSSLLLPMSFRPGVTIMYFALQKSNKVTNGILHTSKGLKLCRKY